MRNNRIVYIWVLAMFAFVVLNACAPAPIDDDATPAPQWLNDNPDLEFGGCKYIKFTTEAWGEEVIQHCWPDGYEVYQVALHNPIRINFNGSYVVQPLDNHGSIGYRLPPMTLGPGKHIVKIYGWNNIEGISDHYEMWAHYTIDGVDGIVMMGTSDAVQFSGNYTAMLTLDAPQLGMYNVVVYLHILHPSMTASSKLTFERITVEAAPK